MPYVISTASNDILYGQPLTNPTGDIHRKGKQVLIKGGSSIANKKTLMTPRGVSTPVTDADLEFLESCAAFQRHKKAGHIKVVKSEIAPEKVVKDMVENDLSSPKLVAAKASDEKPAEIKAKAANKAKG